MTVLDRVFLGVAALVLLIIAGIITFVLAGNMNVILWLTSPGSTLDGGIVALLLLLLVVYLGLMIARRDPDNDKAVVHNAALGEVRIGIGSIKGLIAKKANEVEGVKDISVSVAETEPLKVLVELQVLPDYNVPQLSEELQASVRDYLAETAGIDVAEIKVYVRSITSERTGMR